MFSITLYINIEVTKYVRFFIINVLYYFILYMLEYKENMFSLKVSIIQQFNEMHAIYIHFIINIYMHVQ